MIKKSIATALVLMAFISMTGQKQIQEIEASYIANFMRYIQWPDQANLKTIKVGIYGKSPQIFTALTKNLNGKNIGRAIIEVVEVEETSEIKSCQMLFVPNGRSYKAKKHIKPLGNAAILVITEEQDFQPDIAVINFKVLNSKLAFQLRNDLATQKKITISSRLQQMAVK